MGLAMSRLGGNLGNGLFVPQIYSAKMQAKFYAASVVPAIANHDWEGEITAQGDKVNIRKIPNIIISDSVVNETIDFQEISDESIVLNIDKAKKYAFKVDDIDLYQSDIAIIEKCSEDAAMNMMVAVDQNVLQTVYADAITSITASTATKDNLVDYILQGAQGLDDNFVPRDGNRWVVVSPKVARLLKQSGLSEVQITGDNASPLRNGLIGEIDGMKVYISSNILNASAGSTGATTTQEMCLVGHPSAISFASQFVSNEQVRLVNQWGWGIKGRKVYGFKTTQPKALAVVKVSY